MTTGPVSSGRRQNAALALLSLACLALIGAAVVSPSATARIAPTVGAIGFAYLWGMQFMKIRKTRDERRKTIKDD